MTTFGKYLLFQIVDWLVAAAVLFFLARSAWLSAPLALGFFALWVVKDFVLYPFLRKAYESHVPTGSQRLIGEIGTTTEWLRPEGYVQIHGHLWRAVADPKDQAISPQTSVRVKDAKGLTLTVIAETASDKCAGKESPTSAL